MLREDAQRSYFDRVKDYASVFDRAVSPLKKEYNSPVRQYSVRII